MHPIGALDLATGKIYYRIRPRKRWREFLTFLKSLRERWPGDRLYVVLDNFSPHKHPKVRSWAAGNDVDLVFLPTYASWLNWIECWYNPYRRHSSIGMNSPIAFEELYEPPDAAP